MKMRNLIVATAVGAGAVFGAVAHAAEGDAPKQSMGEYASDAVITTKVKAAFVADETLSALDIAVETTDGNVTLTGTVGTEAETEQAARVARDVEGVKQVQNDIKVDPAKAKPN
ncbi:BON domain-containing protein [Bordetella sp. BOR01]|uniref:BON domain-containing protein n=1 Tax=Bordetella sp. BOR01 TaxID=2854779 RepID=UPI001C49018C|nr:BON domain-containing protein [Bordetella sp. BOR01]MBV7482082.1 BON domain-containing protein [Bordetella sp. BOR01]